MSWLYGTYYYEEFSTFANRDIAWSLFLLFLWVIFNHSTFNPLHTLWLAPSVVFISGLLMVSGISRKIFPIGRFAQIGGLAILLVWLTQ